MVRYKVSCISRVSRASLCILSLYTRFSPYCNTAARALTSDNYEELKAPEPSSTVMSDVPGSILFKKFVDSTARSILAKTDREN
jgi:hypothetical protein